MNVFPDPQVHGSSYVYRITEDGMMGPAGSDEGEARFVNGRNVPPGAKRISDTGESHTGQFIGTPACKEKTGEKPT